MRKLASGVDVWGFVTPLRKVTEFVSLSDLPDKSDLGIARAWLLDGLPMSDHRTAAMALARLLRGQGPLDGGLREALAKELEGAAGGKGRVLKLKGRKHRMDPNRDLFIALAVWQRFVANRANPQYRIKDAQADVAQEIGREVKIVKNAWQKWQRRLRMPLKREK